MHHHTRSMYVISFEFEYVTLNFTALCVFFSVYTRTKNLTAVLRKVIYLFEISLANTKHLCSVFVDLHFYWHFFIDLHSALRYLEFLS